MSRCLPSTIAPPPSSALIRPPPTYMTTMTGSLLIVCCLTSAHVAAAAAAAARVIDARSLIVAIEWEGSKPSFDALGQCDGTAQVDGCIVHVKALLEAGVRGDTPLCLPPKLTKRQCINQP